MFNMVCMVKRSEFIAKIIVCDYVTHEHSLIFTNYKIVADTIL